MSIKSTKLIFGSSSKKGYRPLPLDSVKGTKTEEWSDNSKVAELNVDQLLEGLDGLETIHRQQDGSL